MNPSPHVIILAGGRGSRLGSTTAKALAMIGEQPIIDHLLDILARQSFDRVTLALGHYGDDIRQHFVINSDTGEFRPWQDGRLSLRLMDTGEHCETAGRLKRVLDSTDEPALVCWTDALFDIDLASFWDFHQSQDIRASIVCVHPPSRFGHLQLLLDRVLGYVEKPLRPDDWISAGVFAIEPEALGDSVNEDSSFEQTVLPELAKSGQLAAFRHEGFWQCMDTPADLDLLNRIYENQPCPWDPTKT